MNRHVTQVRRILPSQYQVIFVSVSFSMSSSVSYRDLLEAYSILDTIHGLAECLGNKLRLSIFLQYTKTLVS